MSSALALATVSNLSIGTLFERFLPVSGVATRRNVRLGLAAGIVTALLFGFGYLAFAPRAKLFDGLGETLLFPLWVMILAPSNLVDQATVGLRVARWGAWKNIVHSAVKLAAVVAVASLGSSPAIVLSWMIPAAVVTGAVVVAVDRRAAQVVAQGRPSTVPPRRAVAHYFGSTLFVTVLATVTPLLLPLIVVARLGAEQNAYFGVAWQLVTAFYLILFMLSGPFVSEATASPWHTRRLVGRFLATIAAAAVAGAIGMAFVAPVLLGVIKPGYREATEPMLHAVSIALLFSAVEVAYNAVARLLRRLALSMAVQVLSTGTILVTAWLWVPGGGIGAIGHAYLAGQIVAAVILVVPLVIMVRHLRRSGDRRTPPAPEGTGGGAEGEPVSPLV